MVNPRSSASSKELLPITSMDFIYILINMILFYTLMNIMMIFDNSEDQRNKIKKGYHIL